MKKNKGIACILTLVLLLSSCLNVMGETLGEASDTLFLEVVTSEGKFSSDMKAANGANVSSIQPYGDLKWAYLGKPIQGSSFTGSEMTGSQKWVVKGTLYNGAIWRMHFNNEIDFTEMRSYGYLSFSIYTNAAAVDDLPSMLYLYDNKSATVGVAFPKKDIELNAWNDIKIPISEFTKETELDFDFTTVNRIELFFPKTLSGKESGECPECESGEHTGSVKYTNYDERKISNTVNGTVYSYDKSWFNIYIGNMGFYMSENSYAKVYKENRVLNDMEALRDNIIFAKGLPYALVDGYKKECSAAVTRNKKTYVPYEFISENSGGKKATVFNDTFIDKNGTLYASADEAALLLGKNIYEKDGLVVFSDNNIDIKTDEITKIKNTMSYVSGHLNIGAEGFVTGMLIHPLDSDIRYIRTDVGGCYRWEKETDSWKQLMKVIPEEENNLVGIKSIAVDPQNKDILYAFCGMFNKKNSAGSRIGYHDVLKSYDRGETWQRTYLQAEAGGNVGRTRYIGESMAVDPDNSDIIYVGTLNDGLWYSADGAKTWKKNDSITSWTEDRGISIVMFNEGDIYAMVHGDGLYKSEDNGVTFIRMDGAPSYINRMKFINGALYAAVSGRDDEAQKGGLFKFENGVWTNITPDFNGIGDFVIADEYILVSGEPFGETSAYYIRSLDGGKTWDKFKAGHGLFGCCRLVQNPDDKYSAYATTGEGVMLIKNLTGPLPDTEEHALSNKPVMDENGHLSHEKADEQRVDDGTLTYIPSQKGVEELVGQKLLSVPDADAPLLLISCYDRSFVYCETMTSLAIKGHDDSVYGGGMATGMDYCAENPKFVLRTGRGLHDEENGNVILSTDYGRFGFKLRESWSWKLPVGGALSADVKSGGYPAVFVLTPDSEIDGDGAIWRSFDWGETWEKYDGIDVTYNVSNHYVAYTYNLFISDKADGNAFYYINGSDFWVTRDCGDTWNKVYTFDVALSSPNLCAVPGHAGNVWLESNGRVWHTEDYGNSWTTLDTIEACGAFSFGKGRESITEPAMYIDGTVDGEEGLFISDDMGETWNRMYDDSLNMAVSARGEIAGDMNTYGRVFMSTGGHGVIYYEYIEPEGEIKNTLRVIGSETGEALSSCMAGETLTVSAELSEIVDECAVIVAERGASDKIINVKKLDTVNNTYSVGASALKLDVFLWNGMGQMLPLAEKLTLSVVHQNK